MSKLCWSTLLRGMVQRRGSASVPLTLRSGKSQGHATLFGSQTLKTRFHTSMMRNRSISIRKDTAKRSSWQLGWMATLWLSAMVMKNYTVGQKKRSDGTPETNCSWVMWGSGIKEECSKSPKVKLFIGNYQQIKRSNTALKQSWREYNASRKCKVAKESYSLRREMNWWKRRKSITSFVEKMKNW